MSPPSKPPPPSIISRLYPNVRLAPLTPLRLAGFLPSLIVLCIIALAYITAVPATFIPLLSYRPFLTPLFLIVFHFLFLSTLANYLLLILIDPGSPPHSFSNPPPPHPFPLAHLLHERTYQGFLRYCHECKAYKPDRAHHCSMCQRCILKMDHHCIFVNNCISFNNHKFFISFVTFGFLGCLFVAIFSFPIFSAIISTAQPAVVYGTRIPSSHIFQIAEEAVNNMSQILRTLAMIGYITSSAFAFALAIFVALHFYLVAKGRTTIEMYELSDPVRRHRVLEYDLGSSNNFKSVCGTVPLCWFLPTRAFVEGNGVDWERRELDEEEGPLAV